MSVKIEGNVPVAQRVSTGLHSLDIAFGDDKNVGMPIRCIIELYGREESGKSTLSYFLSGRVASNGTIVLVDLEGGARAEYVRKAIEQSGFSGTLRYVDFDDREGRRTHEKMMKLGADMLLEEDTRAVILDSAAMVQPVMEAEGDIEEAFMGRRAQVLAKWTRRCVSHLNYVEDPKVVLVINHMLSNMKYENAIVTPGGDTLKFGSTMLARIWREETFDDGSFEAMVRVDKQRWGGRAKRIGRVIIQPGVGVSPLLTTAFDAMEEGWARRKPTGVQVLASPDANENKDDSWVTVAKLATLLEDGREGKEELFIPFRERLLWQRNTESTKPKEDKSSPRSRKSSRKTSAGRKRR